MGDGRPVRTEVAPHEMDEMGAHSDDGVTWLPRSRYTRSQARTWCASEWSEPWIAVRILSRYMVYAPDHQDAAEYDGDYWLECSSDTPGAFRVWRCE